MIVSLQLGAGKQSTRWTRTCWSYAKANMIPSVLVKGICLSQRLYRMHHGVFCWLYIQILDVMAGAWSEYCGICNVDLRQMTVVSVLSTSSSSSSSSSSSWKNTSRLLDMSDSHSDSRLLISPQHANSKSRRNTFSPVSRGSFGNPGPGHLGNFAALFPPVFWYKCKVDDTGLTGRWIERSWKTGCFKSRLFSFFPTKPILLSFDGYMTIFFGNCPE